MSDGTKVVNLTPFGRMSNCEGWQVPDGDYVQSIELSYTTLGLQHILITTHKNAVKTRGTKAQNSSTYLATYDRLSPVVGFAAYQTTSMMALGFYSYTCKIDTATQYIGNQETLPIDNNSGGGTD